MFLRASLTALAMLAGVSMHAPVAAATITQSYDFSFTFDSPSVVPSWDGAVTMTYDPFVSGPVNITGFTSNLPTSFGGSLYGVLDYQPAGFNVAFQTVFPNKWTLYICNVSACPTPGGDDFVRITMGFENVLTDTSVPLNSFAISLSPDETPATSSAGQVTLRNTPIANADVPEPSALSLLLGGLGWLTLARWRNRTGANV